MKHYIIWILMFCLVFSCVKKSPGPRYLNDDASNSRNFGLIGINNDWLVLNKGHDITQYDFNGNMVKKLLTGNDLFRTLAVKDSFMAISNQGESSIYKITASGQLSIIDRVPNFYHFSPANELILFDSIMIILSNRFSTQPPNDYSPETYQSLKLAQYNARNNTISFLEKTGNLTFAASSMAVIQDSLLFFMNRRVSKINLRDSIIKFRSFDFDLNPANDITTSISRNNQLVTSNSKNIYFLDYANNAITLKGQIK